MISSSNFVLFLQIHLWRVRGQRHCWHQRYRFLSFSSQLVKIISIAFCRGEIHGYGSRLSSHAYCTLCTSQMRTWWHLTTQTYTTQRGKSFKVILMTKTTTFFWTTKSIPFLPHHLLMTKYRTKKSYWMKRKKKIPQKLLKFKKILAKNTTCRPLDYSINS